MQKKALIFVLLMLGVAAGKAQAPANEPANLTIKEDNTGVLLHYNRETIFDGNFFLITQDGERTPNQLKLSVENGTGTRFGI